MNYNKLLINLVLLSTIGRQTYCTEYCQHETFSASCGPSEIVVIDEAHYGRMQVGRCVTVDYGFIGCAEDVLDRLNRICSRQRFCQFNISMMSEFDNLCPRFLTSYLEASYSCVTAVGSFGCPQMAAPPNSWIERIENNIIIRCNFSMDTSYLMCKGHKWIGDVTNCSGGPEVSLPVKDDITACEKESMPMGLVMAVIIGITLLGVILGLFMLCAVYLFKRRRIVMSQKSSKLNGLLYCDEVLLHH